MLICYIGFGAQGLSRSSVRPIKSGQIPEEHIHAEIGEIISGRKRRRPSSEEVTIFKSVGVAVQDTVAATLALRNAEK